MTNTPRIDLSIKIDPVQSATLPIYILTTLRRAPDDGDPRPCIFHWSSTIHGFSRHNTGFKLFERKSNNTDGAEIPIDHSGSIPLAEELRPLIVTGYNHDLWQLSPGEEIRLQVKLPDKYQRELEPGMEYSLVWPGGECLQWEWGTIEDHMGKEVKKRGKGGKKEKSVVLRASDENKAAFETVMWAPDEDVPGWRRGSEYTEHTRNTSPPPLTEYDRAPDAPKLRVALQGPETISPGEDFKVTFTVKYETKSPTDAKPIIFHNIAFVDEGWRLYKLTPNQSPADPSSWKHVDFDTNTGFIIVDEPDISVHPLQHRDFTVLEPGATWTDTYRMEDAPWDGKRGKGEKGSVYRFTFKGVEIDWWDWGGEKEHRDTTVKLPCFQFGSVTEPSDNGGRPRLLVPGSQDEVEFRVI